MKIILGIIICLCLVPFILMLLSWKSKNTWYCRVMGWHKEPKEKGFDGLSAYGKCPRCNKDVLLDGQGNWF